AVGQNVRPQSMPPLRQDPGEFIPTTTLQCVDQIYTRRIAVLRSSATRVTSFFRVHKPWCYNACSYKCRCRVMIQKVEEQVAPVIRARIPPSVEKAAATSLALGVWGHVWSPVRGLAPGGGECAQ